MKKLVIGFFIIFMGCLAEASAMEHLVIREVRNENPVYEEFCLSNSVECDLTESKQIIEYNDKFFDLIQKVSRGVNEVTTFINDNEQYGVEEYWSLPTEMGGDCEDNALKKRSTLVSKYGVPRGALRMVTAFHREKFYAHALLAVLTTKGTFLLDQDNEDVVLAQTADYIIEAMELPGRKWARFEQEW